MKTNFLIIEDDSHWRDAIDEAVLQRHADAHVYQVESLNNALNIMSRQKFDVIISGLYEYDSLGGRALEKILKISNYAGTPVIFISSEARPVDASTMAKLGAFDYMVVERINFSMEQLLTSIDLAIKMRGMPKAFISYSSSDRDFVKQLAESLQSRDVRVWWEPWEIKAGDSIINKLEEGIASSSVLILILSPASVSSRWIQEELDAALIKQINDRNIRILPVLKDDCSIPPILRSRKYADFTKDYNTAFEDLYKALTTDQVS